MTRKWEILTSAVVENSMADNWAQARLEWLVVGVEEDEEGQGECVCTHPGLRYLFTIQNEHNGKELEPIGSTCIQRFEVDSMNAQHNDFMDILRLEEVVHRERFLSLTSAQFTRSSLLALYRFGAFDSNRFNGNNPKNDYAYLLRLFNSRHAPSPREQKRVNALMWKINAFLSNTRSGARPRVVVYPPDGYRGAAT